MKIVKHIISKEDDSLVNGEANLYLIGCTTKKRIRDEGYITKMGFYNAYSRTDLVLIYKYTNI